MCGELGSKGCDLLPGDPVGPGGGGEAEDKVGVGVGEVGEMDLGGGEEGLPGVVEIGGPGVGIGLVSGGLEGNGSLVGGGLGVGEVGEEDDRHGFLVH